MLKMFLDGDSWEADYFVSAEEYKAGKADGRHLDNMLMEAAVYSGFVRRNTAMPGLLRCTIPGCDRTVLLENGLIREPYFGRNLDESRWAEDYSWAFRRSFTLPEEWKNAERIILDFRGVDYKATFILNERPLGVHEGMFIPAVFDVTDIVDFQGENLLAVAFEPAPKGSPNHRETAPADFARYHRTQMSFGWDWSRRFVTTGIWDSVILHGYREANITDCAFRHSGKAVELTLDMEAERTGEMELAVSVTPENFEGEAFTAQFTLNLEAGSNCRKVNFEMPETKLWYPNGAGAQHLYRLELKLGSSRWSNIIGFRTLRMERNPNSPVGAYNLTFNINGESVFAKGLNWVPAELMFSRNCRENYERLIKLAAEAGFNIFRIWGGGMVEKECFYQLCDRYGIMVWQEFMHACSSYSKEPEYLAFKRREGEAILRKIRNHVSLSMVCGGNEMQYYGEIPDSPLLLQYGELTAKFAPDLPYHVSSPDLSRPGERNHGPWHFLEHSIYNSHFRLLASETGCNGMPEYESLRKFIPEDELALMQGQSLNFHFLIQSGPKSQRLPLEKFSNLSPEEFCQASMFAQADAGEYIFEHYRRLFPRAGGCFFWQYNEPWPTCSYSIVDYYGVPKMAYYALKKANSPLLVSLQEKSWCISEHSFKAKCFLTGDRDGEPGTILLWGMTADGREVFSKSIPAQPVKGTIPLVDISEALPSDSGTLLVFLKFIAGDGSVLFENTRIYGVPDFRNAFNLPTAEIEFKAAGTELKIRNTGKVPAVKVRVSLETINVFWSDNYFTIAPGEEKTVVYDTPEIPEKVKLSGWNIAGREVEL